jgi:hypothetical protein
MIAALTKYKIPVIIVGHILKYSEGPECKHVKGDWTCFFQPMSKCNEILKTKGKYGCSSVMPASIDHAHIHIHVHSCMSCHVIFSKLNTHTNSKTNL